MRIMALDVGEKRIGIAVSDPMGWTAQGHSVLERKGLKKDIANIKSIFKEYDDLEEIVVGMPLNMDGSKGVAAESMEQFIADLAGSIEIPVSSWDERLTTVSAERVLIDADLSRKKRKKVIDKVAAIYILQSYLDRKNYRLKEVKE